MGRNRAIIELGVAFCVAISAGSQTTPTVRQTASQSSCSNIVALSGARVDCLHLTPAQSKALDSIPSILKMTLENQDYLNTILNRLQEMTAPDFGNLGDRAVELSDEIMQNVYFHGLAGPGNRPKQSGIPQLKVPTNQDELAERDRTVRALSNHFRTNFFDKVMGMREEFAQFHLKDRQLDVFFEDRKTTEQADREMEAVDPSHKSEPISPMEIEEVAERLRALANQIPVEREPPRLLPFSISNVQPDKPSDHEIVVTIDPENDLVSGYIAVEFNEPNNIVRVDLAGGKWVWWDDVEVIGNRPLKNYLLAHGNDPYVLEIGTSPITPSRPLHVIAEGSQSLTVNKVTFFEK